MVSGYPSSPNWTLDFEPAFSQWFYFPLSPRSIFHTSQRFPLSKHVISGSMSPRSLFPTGQRFFPPEMIYDVTGSSSGHVIALDQSEASTGTIWAQFTTSTQWSLSLCKVQIKSACNYHKVSLCM